MENYIQEISSDTENDYMLDTAKYSEKNIEKNKNIIKKTDIAKKTDITKLIEIHDSIAIKFLDKQNTNKKIIKKNYSQEYSLFYKQNDDINSGNIVANYNKKVYNQCDKQQIPNKHNEIIQRTLKHDNTGNHKFESKDALDIIGFHDKQKSSRYILKK